MPKRKSNIGRHSRKVSRARDARQQSDAVFEDIQETEEERYDFMLPNWSAFRCAAFNYNPVIEYNKHELVSIGPMRQKCEYCNALRWKAEPSGMCCLQGKVQLSTLEEPPQPLKGLLMGETAASKGFLRNIRQYNSCFQMTSFGVTGKTENSPTTFTVQGQIYHRIGGLLPESGENHKFLQIYFMGDENVNVDRRCENIQGLQRDIVLSLENMLQQKNKLIDTFTIALNRWPTNNNYKIVIHADKVPNGEHERRYNAPAINDVAVLMVGDNFTNCDIVLKKKNNSLIRVAETHRFYDSFQYPLIFWKGQEGYSFSIPLVNPTSGHQLPNRKVTAMKFYGYNIMVRDQQFNSLLHYRQLLNQFIVDMYAKIESERLLYIRMNQGKLRAENYIHLMDAVNSDENINPNNVGQKIVLPSSFTGGPRYMHEHAQDALAYVREYGRPDFFITMTCNPKWPEITAELMLGQCAKDRHDIVARVFRQKVNKFVHVIDKGELFRGVKCWMYTVEWQKRGLPHIHALIWLAEKIRPDEVDQIISAEIPDKQVDPSLHSIVLKHMVHGPCGAFNMNSPCMKDGQCSKKYPRALITETQISNNGYPLYRRRSQSHGGFSSEIVIRGEGINIDNRWIVPYSPILSKMFNAHINVEICSSVKSIKYVCKYIHKGSDQAVFNLQKPNAPVNSLDEIYIYQTGRYISSNEAFWRILGFPVHDRHPTVMHLSVHLENGQRIYFNEDNFHERMQNPPNTTLTAFFKICQTDEFAKSLLYSEGTPVKDQPGIVYSNAIGRVYTVHVNNFECFCLRLLLHKIRGPTSFQYLKTVNNEVLGTYKEACEVLGLLEKDEHWDDTMREAVMFRSAPHIRHLFSILVSTCGLTDPLRFWETYKEAMSEDILQRYRRTMEDVNFSEAIFNEALIDIENKIMFSTGKRLSLYGLPNTERNYRINNEVLREQSYNVYELKQQVETMVPMLLPEQRAVYDLVVKKISDDEGALLFLDAPGGTGKTFLINLLLKHVRKNKDIALAVASSGIAATLLTGGRTAHSALKLPLNLAFIETPVCNISKNSEKAEVLRQCKLLVWDECTMSHKHALEALDRTLRDLRNVNKLMGGLTVLLAGDFRQTLPIIPRGTAADEINACLKESVLWANIIKLNLTENMRVRLYNDSLSEQYSTHLLRIGEGRCAVDSNGRIEFPENFCNLVNSSQELIDNVFPNLTENYLTSEWLCQRAILAPKNDDIHHINSKILSMLPGESTTFLSVDTVLDKDHAVHYPTEFLNSLEIPGVPSHMLSLKEGIPVILLRNLDAPRLCNGTRLLIKNMMRNIVGCTVLTGCAKGEYVLIPRIPIIPTDFPFEFKRLQFPLKVSFAMTINKSQGQTLKVVGVNLQKQCFSHGQLYVACSRVSSGSNLYIYAPGNKVVNVVYKKVLQN